MNLFKLNKYYLQITRNIIFFNIRQSLRTT